MAVFGGRRRSLWNWRRAGAATVLVLAASSVAVVPAGAATRSTVQIQTIPELTYGSFTTVAGRILSGGAGTGHVQVVVYGRGSAARRWSRVATVRTTGTGRFHVLARPGTNTRYFAFFPGTSGRRAASSRAVTTLVRPRTTLTASAASVLTGQSVTLTTSVAPSHAGTAVTYQWFDGMTWKSIGTGTLNVASQAATGFSVPNVGSQWFRVVLAAHRDHSEGRALVNVAGVAAPVTGAQPPPTTPPPTGGPAVYEARDLAPGGTANAVTSRQGFSIHGGTNTCSYSGVSQMTVTDPNMVSDGASVTDYYRNNFWTYDPRTRQWTYLGSSGWNGSGRFLATAWYDAATGQAANHSFTFAPGYYYGITQTFLDGGDGNRAYELAVPFLVDSGTLYACLQ